MTTVIVKNGDLPVCAGQATIPLSTGCYPQPATIFPQSGEILKIATKTSDRREDSPPGRVTPVTDTEWAGGN